MPFGKGSRKSEPLQVQLLLLPVNQSGGDGDSSPVICSQVGQVLPITDRDLSWDQDNDARLVSGIKAMLASKSLCVRALARFFGMPSQPHKAFWASGGERNHLALPVLPG